MKARKTVNVSKVLEVANKLLALPNDEVHNAAYRRGVTSLLEATLHDANVYAGFNYLAWISEGGCEQWRKDNEALGAPANAPVISTEAYLGDESRRVYYSHSSLGAAKLAAESDGGKVSAFLAQNAYLNRE